VTNIYIYCVFEKDEALYGVYSSSKAAHRDALKLCNTGHTPVYVKHQGRSVEPDVTLLRNIFKGAMDIKVTYHSNKSTATILKTKLRE
jgi:hypothetical protein